MKKKILSVLLVIVLVMSVLVLTGCEDKATNTESNVKTEENKSSKEDKKQDKKDSQKDEDKDEDDDEKDSKKDEDKDEDDDEKDSKKDEDKDDKKDSKKDEDKDDKKDSKKTSNAADDNSNYIVKIKGEKYKAGDKISSLSKVGLSQDEKVLTEAVKKNTYVIGAGSIYNDSKKRVFNMTPYNNTSDEITVADAVIGGFEVGEYKYDIIAQEVLDLDIEVAGGIKLGSSLEDVKKVFGETDSTYKAESLGYTVYTYKSSEVYRSYEITVDQDGKVSKIRWQNLVFDEK